MIVKNNKVWTKRANHPDGFYGSTCPVNFDFAKCKTVRVVYWRSRKTGKRYCMISPGRY